MLNIKNISVVMFMWVVKFVSFKIFDSSEINKYHFPFIIISNLNANVRSESTHSGSIVYVLFRCCDRIIIKTYLHFVCTKNKLEDEGSFRMIK